MLPKAAHPPPSLLGLRDTIKPKWRKKSFLPSKRESVGMRMVRMQDRVAPSSTPAMRLSLKRKKKKREEKRRKNKSLIGCGAASSSDCEMHAVLENFSECSKAP